jgi:transcription elongation GreA/GreB family factor
MLTVMLVVCAGLAVDGGRVVGAHVSAADHAENAARRGAQEVVGIRAGEPHLDPLRARAAAAAYLDAQAVDGTVLVVGDEVTVTVTTHERATLLHLVGIDAMTVSATRSARPVVS